MITNNYQYLEPRIKHIFERKLKRRGNGPYTPKTESEVRLALTRLFENMDLVGITISDLKRMAGGASKEQFSFMLEHNGVDKPVRLVLRMDPLEGIVETCRLREAQLLKALKGIIPVPDVFAIDGEGDYLGSPGMVCNFIDGVTAPTTGDRGVTGIGSTYGSFTEVLAPQFVKYLSDFHSFEDWDNKDVGAFVIPQPNTKESALYQVDQWECAWKIDKVEPVPMVTLAAQWLRENAPVCEAPCLVHCDYRIGNFMFSEETGKMTAVLDWELAHFGDFHEDLAWILHKFFGTRSTDGEFFVCGLMTREDFLRRYQEQSGRVVNEKILKYYEILNAWKCAVMTTAYALMSASCGTNHQEVVLSWLATATGVHTDQMIKSIHNYEKM